MPTILVRVLGPIELEQGGEPKTVRSAGRRRMLAMLAVRRGEIVPAGLLTDQLQISAAALRTLVCRLRVELGEGVLVTHQPGYGIERSVCDAFEAERLLRVARVSEPTAALASLDEALSWWRGPSLMEFAHEPWARSEALRLDELRANATEDRARLLIDAGRCAEAIASLHSHIGRHPLRDRARRLMMAALADVGRVTESLRAYHDYRQYLVDEVGAEPPRATRELERDIVRGTYRERLDSSLT